MILSRLSCARHGNADSREKRGEKQRGIIYVEQHEAKENRIESSDSEQTISKQNVSHSTGVVGNVGGNAGMVADNYHRRIGGNRDRSFGSGGEQCNGDAQKRGDGLFCLK